MDILRQILVAMSCLLAVQGLAGSANAATFTFLSGSQDNFSTSDGVESPSPSIAHSASLRNSFANDGVDCIVSAWRCQERKFDEVPMDRNFIDTFDLSSVTGDIISAKLELVVKPNGYAGNDSMGLYFVTNPNSASWGSYFGSGNSSPGLLNQLWDSSNFSQGVLFNLDLAALPNVGGTTTNLLAALASQRSLDIQIQDDTSVDYVKLTIETVPEPTAAWGLLLVGGLAWQGTRHRQLKKAPLLFEKDLSIE